MAKIREEGITITIQIKLDTLEEILKFVKVMKTYKGSAIVRCGNYKLDAKSLLGLLALETGRELTLEFSKHEKGLLEQVGFCRINMTDIKRLGERDI